MYQSDPNISRQIIHELIWPKLKMIETFILPNLNLKNHRDIHLTKIHKDSFLISSLVIFSWQSHTGIHQIRSNTPNRFNSVLIFFIKPLYYGYLIILIILGHPHSNMNRLGQPSYRSDVDKGWWYDQPHYHHYIYINHSLHVLVEIGQNPQPSTSRNQEIYIS